MGEGAARDDMILENLLKVWTQGEQADLTHSQ